MLQLRKKFKELIFYFIPDIESKNSIEIQEERIRILSFVIGSFCFFAYVPGALNIGLKYQAIINLFAGLITLSCAFLSKLKVSKNLVSWLFLITLTFTIFIQLFCKQGLQDPLAPTLVYPPIFALLLSGKKEARIILFIAICLTCVLYYFEHFKIPRPN